MRTYFVYILQCADNSFYIGLTNNIKRRVLEHSTGYYPNSYTSKRLPIELLYREIYACPYKAREREIQLKGWSRVKKIALIENDFDALPGLSKKFFKRTKGITLRYKNEFP